MTKNFSTKNRTTSKVLACGTASLLLAISSPSIVAQEVQTALAKKAKKELEVEVIEVTGVRSSLESALLTKRDANSIVDAISANDVDALPALDLGEALQVIPGVQLERSGEGRQSEISLRGLSGGFVKTTAFGQGFATPSRSYSDVGSSNPFSSFESSVFDGITVVKSPTADMQAGGIAGVVDQKMQHALSKKSGKFSVSLGSRYEELTKNWDPTLKLSGTKHLIKDELAIAFKAAASGQTFRRDTANFTNWETLGLEHPRGGTRGVNSDTIEEYKTKWGLGADTEVRGVAQGRNVTEYSDGDRFSMSGNIEWKPIEDLKLGAHLLYTKRNLDSGTKQDAAYGSGMNPRNSRNNDMFHKIEPDMDTAPFLYDVNENGQDVYGVSKTHITDGDWQITNRETTFLEESKGIFLYGDYITDNWAFNSVVTHSKSENQFMNIGLDFRVQGHHSPAQGGSPVIPTGINSTIDAADGNINNASVVGTGIEDINFSIPWSVTENLSASCLSQRHSLNDNRKLTFCLTGRVDNPKREVSSAEFNAQRFVDFGFGDTLKFESIKFGVRHSIESLDNRDQQITLGGANLANINNATVEGKPLVSDGQASFFNGEYDGAFGKTGGWLTVDNLELRADLQDGLADIDGGVIAAPSGFYERKVGPHSQRYATNFSAEQSISAAYVMTEFEGELGEVPYSGNIGLRYVYTDNEFDGFKRDRDNPAGDLLVPETIKSDYNHLLPSANFSFELHEDVVLRAAYNEGFVRPNLRILTPSTDLRSGNETATVTLPSALVEPYDAKNLDLSLEWYNRDGSALSVGVFKKEITGFFFTNDQVCPEGNPQIIETLGSDITRTSTGPESFTCTQNEPHLDANGELQIRDVTVNERQNSDGQITLTGVEIAIQQKLDFLPYPWNGLGGVFNYTYIDQEANDEVDNNNNKLYEVAPESFNVVGYYENDGYSFRLAYNWKDDSLLQATNTYLGLLPRVQKATGRLDASASYEFNSNLKVFLRAYNLTDEKRKESWGFNEKAVSRVDYTGRILEASVSYIF